MTGLWTGIALLTLAAVAFVLLPLVRARKLQQQEVAEDRERQNVDIFRERLAELEQEKTVGNLAEAEFEELKVELERSLLQDVEQPTRGLRASGVSGAQWIAGILLALLVPAIAMGLYMKIGSAPKLQLALERQAHPDPFDGRKPTLEEVVAELKHELDVDPNNPEGWYMLATTYMGMGRYDDGVKAFSQVLDRLPKDAPQYPGVMGQYAQALYFAKGGKLDDEVRKQVDATLKRDPGDVTALGLLGIGAFGDKRYDEAIKYWAKALENADTTGADSLRAGIRRAQAELKALGKPVPEVAGLEPAQIRLSVKLGKGVGTDLSPDQTVFVYARPVGGRMPLAAVKLKVSDLPKEVVLDDSLAMTPKARLSSVDEVEVGARISLHGTPEAKRGDLYGTLNHVAVHGQTQPLDLVIDQVVE